MRRARPSWAMPLALAAAGALAVAIVVEHGLGIAPCELCLVERWPWRLALAIGLAALLLPQASRVLRAIAVVDMLVSAGLGVLHAGVERGAWPSPFPSCHAPPLRGGSIADQLASLPTRAAKPCDAATFLVPHLPISMAEANLILSILVLASVLLLKGRPGRWAR